MGGRGRPYNNSAMPSPPPTPPSSLEKQLQPPPTTYTQFWILMQPWTTTFALMWSLEYGFGSSLKRGGEERENFWEVNCPCEIQLKELELVMPGW